MKRDSRERSAAQVDGCVDREEESRPRWRETSDNWNFRGQRNHLETRGTLIKVDIASILPLRRTRRRRGLPRPREFRKEPRGKRSTLNESTPNSADQALWGQLRPNLRREILNIYASPAYQGIADLKFSNSPLPLWKGGGEGEGRGRGKAGRRLNFHSPSTIFPQLGNWTPRVDSLSSYQLGLALPAFSPRKLIKEQNSVPRKLREFSNQRVGFSLSFASLFCSSPDDTARPSKFSSLKTSLNFHCFSASYNSFNLTYFFLFFFEKKVARST